MVSSGVPWAYSEFLLGHKVDPLGYDKSPWTPEGEQKMRERFDRIRPMLNILTWRGRKEGHNNFEEIVQLLALLKGADLGRSRLWKRRYEQLMTKITMEEERRTGTLS